MEQPQNIPVDRPTPQPVKPVRHTYTLTLLVCIVGVVIVGGQVGVAQFELWLYWD